MNCSEHFQNTFSSSLGTLTHQNSRVGRLAMSFMKRLHLPHLLRGLPAQDDSTRGWKHVHYFNCENPRSHANIHCNFSLPPSKHSTPQADPHRLLTVGRRMPQTVHLHAQPASRSGVPLFEHLKTGRVFSDLKLPAGGLDQAD